MVDLAEELSRHHFVGAVLDETCDVQVTCSDTQEEKTTVTVGLKARVCAVGDLTWSWPQR